MSPEVIGKVILHVPPLCVILIHTHKKLSKRIRCMTEFRFSPSFLNRKQPPHLPMSACFPVCAALLSLLLAPALGRKSPTAQCTITSVPYISHENRHYFECLFGKHRQRGPRFMLMPACWLLLGRSLYQNSQSKGPEIADTLYWPVS